MSTLPAQQCRAGEGAFSKLDWKPVFEGVSQASLTLAAPRPLRAQVLKVSLATPGLSVVATPDNGDAPGETTGQKTTNFLKAMKCQAAVNAGPFDKVSSQEGLGLDVSGLQVSGGKTVSPDNGYPALIFLADGTARIQKKPFPGKGIQEAVCGFHIILSGGKTVATDLALHPRTAAGLSADGRTMWLLVVDGRQAGYSEGCTTVEMAEWFRDMGAVSGINLDGGGTTTMVLQDAAGNPRIVNRPIHAGIPGLERPAGSHLGIRAAALGAAEGGK
ncbi:MAG: hypothetical protein JWL81_847 [Verrucomicrobiales bacterium]|nr:hypothetical protein [Verrucomicrobiales bacterium]